MTFCFKEINIDVDLTDIDYFVASELLAEVNVCRMYGSIVILYDLHWIVAIPHENESS